MSRVDELEMKARVDEILNRCPRSAWRREWSVTDAWRSSTATAWPTSRRARHGGHRFPDRLHHQDVHRDRRDAAAGAWADRPGTCRPTTIFALTRLIPANASFPPATVRHLLTHTSGIPEVIHPARSLRYLFGERQARATTTCPRGVLPLRSAPGGRTGHPVHLRLRILGRRAAPSRSRQPKTRIMIR